MRKEIGHRIMDQIRKWIVEIDSMHGEWGWDGQELRGDDAECGKSRGLHGMSQQWAWSRVLWDVTYCEVDIKSKVTFIKHRCYIANGMDDQCMYLWSIYVVRATLRWGHSYYCIWRYSKTGAHQTDVTHWHSGNPQFYSICMEIMTGNIPDQW